ncbi:MAG TPA: hypothetical protein PKD70_06370 [Saprospiraceae bacterium]|nr:hypothetical protein [Saprospiraceae bacterium]HMP13483.1 hypothetical protein [Saprospiraceae bacterium]
MSKIIEALSQQILEDEINTLVAKLDLESLQYLVELFNLKEGTELVVVKAQHVRGIQRYAQLMCTCLPDERIGYTAVELPFNAGKMWMCNTCGCPHVIEKEGPYCQHSCGPSNYHKGGKCDTNGCYK